MRMVCDDSAIIKFTSSCGDGVSSQRRRCNSFVSAPETPGLYTLFKPNISRTHAAQVHVDGK